MAMNLEKIKDRIPEHVYLQIKEFGGSFGLTSDVRLAHFLGTCNHESQNFTKYEEVLNYSAKRLAEVWPSRFANGGAPNELAIKIAKKSDVIAYTVYANRLGNGRPESRDGWNYRGRGAIMLTGKANYKAFGDSIGVDLVKDPDLVKTKYMVTAALWFFHTNGLFLICDSGIDLSTCKKLRRRVQGGTIGLGAVCDLTKDYYKLLTA